eukprot:2659511-Rhodomonas_salina.1
MLHQALDVGMRGAVSQVWPHPPCRSSGGNTRRAVGNTRRAVRVGQGGIRVGWEGGVWTWACAAPCPRSGCSLLPYAYALLPYSYDPTCVPDHVAARRCVNVGMRVPGA